MGTGRELLWFYVRPTLHAALAERAARRGRDLELEIVEILESATQPPPARRANGRAHGHLVVVDTDGPRAW